MMFASNQPLTAWVLLQKQPKIVRKNIFQNYIHDCDHSKTLCCQSISYYCAFIFFFFTSITIITIQYYNSSLKLYIKICIFATCVDLKTNRQLFQLFSQ
jgi:hypothetical protein